MRRRGELLIAIELSNRTWEYFRNNGWTSTDIRKLSTNDLNDTLTDGFTIFPIALEVLSMFLGSKVQGVILFGITDTRDAAPIILDWSCKTGVKLFPIGHYDSIFFVSATGAIFETDTDTEYIWKWGNSFEESFDNLLFNYKSMNEEQRETTRISDGFGNIVDF
jgi:SUKH-3 immunity protein